MDMCQPPGVEGVLKYYSNGGDEASWLPLAVKKHYTNVFVVQNDKLLLGFKKRGFGKFMYNGFGGKVEEGETSLQAACRELEEEAGIRAPLTHAGILLFLNEGAERAFHIDIYRADSYTGTIVETEEMRPEWFTVATSKQAEERRYPAIPYENMWSTDIQWLPLLISGQRFSGRADFSEGTGGSYVPRKWWFGLTD